MVYSSIVLVVKYSYLRYSGILRTVLWANIFYKPIPPTSGEGGYTLYILLYYSIIYIVLYVYLYIGVTIIYI